jgi:hypothetical protein
VATAPDNLIVTGPNNRQVSADSVLLTPTGGSQGSLADFLNGGTVAAGGALTLFGSITPAGSNAATATKITSLTTQLGTAASTTGAVLPLAASLVGKTQPLLLINSGTAAIHLYGTVDTIDGTAGATGVTFTNGQRVFVTPVAAGAWITGPSGTIVA